MHIFEFSSSSIPIAYQLFELKIPNMLDAHYLWVCHLSIHIRFNHNWTLKLRNQYHVDGRTQNQICSKPSLLYFVVVQGLIYSTAKPGQLGHCSTHSMGSPQILWSVRKKGRGFKKGNEITFYARVAIEANKTPKVQTF